MLRLADIAVTEGRLMNALFYYRAAELFTTRDDTDKKFLYDKFIVHLYKAFQDDEIENFENLEISQTMQW